MCFPYSYPLVGWLIAGEDPETRRMRTVKNIADLRQNLEETMSSLRGTQISHRYCLLAQLDTWNNKAKTVKKCIV